MKKIVFALLVIFSSVSYAQNEVGTSNKQNIPADTLSVPQVMIRLCNISYITDKTDKKSIVKKSIQSQIGWDLVWGPEELKDVFGITYSAMYVAKNPTSEEYAVVIRGTNPESLKSWLSEDFEIHKSVKFSKYVSSAPPSAKISKGTCNGLNDLIRLKDAEHNGNIVRFFKMIQEVKTIKNIYVTGHSLGGTLTPALYMYLCYKLYGGPASVSSDSVDSGPYSFAGLTAGNQEFNDLLQTYIQGKHQNWRFVNPYDIAPKLWDSLDQLKNIYSANKLHFGFPESEFMDYLFDRAKKNNYMQPPNSEFPLPSNYNKCETIWLFQALYQHHYTTYQSLIDQCCPKK